MVFPYAMDDEYLFTHKQSRPFLFFMVISFLNAQARNQNLKVENKRHNFFIYNSTIMKS